MKKFTLLFFVLILMSCREDTPTPKPVGYFRIDLPEVSYDTKEPEYCPFKFPISKYGRVEYTTPPSDPVCWFNLSYPEFDAKVYFTYKEVDGNLRELIEESRALTYEHQIKANRINEKAVSDTSRSVFGLVYELGGAVASPVQLYLTDSTSHFLRGSLYFNARPNPDSIGPVLNFIEGDIDQMVQELEWKN
ncbi:gliding motility lipoprotein GldD [Cryomorphaceae bacterium 1068]|nr:gliding motility lipoprotein GldD [Cryomorphaceae bacterium 1068]